MLIQNVKTDLHTHGWTGQEPGFGQFVLKILGERGKRNLQTIAEKGFEQEQDTLIGFINFNDTRYQKIVNTRGELPKNYNLYDDNVQRFVGVYGKNRDLWSFILRGQEIPTNEGHVLVLGNNKEIKRRTIEDVLKEAKDMNALIVGDHFLGLKGLGKENIIRYIKYLDLLEYGNSNFPELTSKSKDIGEKLKIPGLYNSDSHNLERMFSSYMIFPELDFSDWKTLREGIIKSAENEKMGYYAGKNRRFEIPIHFAAVVYNISRQKMGLVKMPGYEIE